MCQLESPYLKGGVYPGSACTLDLHGCNLLTLIIFVMVIFVIGQFDKNRDVAISDLIKSIATLTETFFAIYKRVTKL